MEPINVWHLSGSPSELHKFYFVQFSRSSSRPMFFCSNGFHTIHVVCTCTDLLCVVCIGLLSAEFATVNTGLAYALETFVSVEYS